MAEKKEKKPQLEFEFLAEFEDGSKTKGWTHALTLTGAMMKIENRNPSIVGCRVCAYKKETK